MKTNSPIVIILLLFSIISTEIKAQQTTFTKVFYDPVGGAQAYSIIKTFDNNFMIAGEKDDVGLVIKMSPAGDIIWDKKYAGLNYERFNDIISTKDNCFVITGYYGDPWSPARDILCMKINSDGDTIWAKKINIGTDAVGLSVQQTADSGYIIAGYETTPASLMVIIKLNKNGVISWSKTFSAGSYKNCAYSAKQTPDGGYIVSGYTESSAPNYPNAVLFKLTADGTVSWSLKNTLVAPQTSTGGDVIVENDRFIWCLYPHDVVKTDFSGNVIWSKSYFNPQYSDPELPVPTLTKLTDGGYLILSGTSMHEGYLVKINSSGNPLWSQELTLITMDITESADHGIIALGNGPIMGVIMADIMNPQIGIIKMDSAGNSISCVIEQWAGVYIDTVLLEPVTMVSSDAGIETVLNQSITLPSLTSINSCITVTGKVPERNRNENTFTIIPNPNNGRFQIIRDQTEYSDIKSIEVYNSTGQKVCQSYDRIISGISIDLSSSPSGLYFLKVELSDRTYSQKFIIDR